MAEIMDVRSSNLANARIHSLLIAAFSLALLLFTGCATPQGQRVTQEDMEPYWPTDIAPGDVLDIKFPSAPQLDAVHKVGPDGTLIFPLVGKVIAAGKTVDQLRDDLLALYENELQDKEVLISKAGSGDVVWVNGAVMRPGRVPMDRPLTVLEAIMEAGGYGSASNLKRVEVIRYVDDRNTIYYLNLEPVLSGNPVSPFYLRPRDIVNVPQKVEWF